METHILQNWPWPVTGEFTSQRAGSVELWSFICCFPEPTAVEKVQSPVQGYVEAAFWGHLAHWNQECPQLFWL